MQNQFVLGKKQNRRFLQTYRPAENIIRYSCLALFCAILLFALQLNGGTVNSQSTQSRKKIKLLLPLGHKGPITALSYSSDGKLLASGGSDGNIIIWSPQTGVALKNLRPKETQAEIMAIDFSPDGKVLASGDSENAVRLWDVETATEIRLIKGHTGVIGSVKYSPDGKILASQSFEGIKLWDVATGRQIRSLTTPFGLGSLAFSPDGKILANSGIDKNVNLWDVETGQLIRVLIGHVALVVDIAFSPDGKQLLSGSYDHTAKLWDVSTGILVRSLTGNEETVSRAAFSVDGKIIATAGYDRVVLWDRATGKKLYTLKQSTRIRDIVFSPDGRSLATAGIEPTINLWDISERRLSKQLEGQGAPLYSVAFSPTVKLIAVGSQDSTIKLWNLERGQSLPSLSGHTNALLEVAFSPDGKLLASSSLDNTIKLWDAASGTEVNTFAGCTGCYSFAFSRDGKTLISAGNSRDGNIYFWDVIEGKILKTLNFMPPTDRRTLSYNTLIAISPNGEFLASGNAVSKTSIWRIKSGEKLSSLPCSPSQIAFSPDSKMLACVNQTFKDETALPDGTSLDLFEIAAGRKIKSFPVAEDSDINAISFSPNGEILAGGGNNDAVKFWDVKSGKQTAELKHEDDILSLSFSPDGKHLAVAGRDGQLKIWDVTARKELTSLIAFGKENWVSVTPDGLFDAPESSQGILSFAIGSETVSLKQLRGKFYVQGLLSKILKGEPLPKVDSTLALYPKVEFKQPAKNSKKLELKLINQGGGIGKTQIFFNGKEFIADARAANFDSSAEQADLTVDLSTAQFLTTQANRISIITYNAAGDLSSSGTDITLGSNFFISSPPKFYAIVGGVSDYDGDKLDLRFAAKDASEMAAALETGAKRLFGVKNTHVTLLSDKTKDNRAKAPTKENFNKAFAEIAARAKPQDVFVIYLSGNGTAINLPEGNVYLYLTKEASSHDRNSLAEPRQRERISLSSEEMARWMKKIPALKQVVILDTCAAGSFTVPLKARDIPDDAKRALERLKERTGTWILMGSAADGVSYETSQYGQGLLTYSLLQGMKGAALRDGQFVDVSRLLRYAVEKVPELARNIGGSQIPLVFDPASQPSFDIGMMTQADRESIQLATPKPLVLRPTFINDEKLFDDLGISQMVQREFKKASRSDDGESGKIVFIDSENNFSDAVQTSGKYSVEGKSIKLKLSLVINQIIIATLELQGSVDKLDSFADLIADAVIEAVYEKRYEKPRASKQDSKKSATPSRNQNAALEKPINGLAETVSRSVLASYRFNGKQVKLLDAHGADLTHFEKSDSASNQPVPMLTAVLVRPEIKNFQTGADDNLQIQSQVVTTLNNLIAKNDNPETKLVYKDVDDEPNAFKIKGTYESKGEDRYRLRLTLWRNGNELVRNDYIYCDKLKIHEEFVKPVVDMVIDQLKIPVLEKGINRVLTAEEIRKLNSIESSALLIATKDYKGLTPLNNPTCDAQTIGAELKINYGFKEVTEVFNQDRTGIMNAIAKLGETPYSKDVKRQLFVFISGHGTSKEYVAPTGLKQFRGWLATKDVASENELPNTSVNYISFEDLAAQISTLPFQQIFVVVDSCRSGAFLTSAAKSVENVVSEDDVAAILRNLEHPARLGLTASNEKYNVIDGEKCMHSPFTRSILRALRTYGGTRSFMVVDDIISKGDMPSLKPAPIRGEFQYHMPGGNFVFIRHTPLEGKTVGRQPECKCDN